MGVILNPFTGELEVVKPTTGFLTKSQADTYYYPLSTNPEGYLTSADQYWQRTGTVLSPVNAGDSISVGFNSQITNGTESLQILDYPVNLTSLGLGVVPIPTLLPTTIAGKIAGIDGALGIISEDSERNNILFFHDVSTGKVVDDVVSIAPYFTADGDAFTGIGINGELEVQGDIRAVGSSYYNITGANLVAENQVHIKEGGATPTAYTIIQGSDQSGATITYTLPVVDTNGLLRNTAGSWSWDNISYITLGSLSVVSPIDYNSGTGAFSFDFSTSNVWTGNNAFQNAISAEFGKNATTMIPGYIRFWSAGTQATNPFYTDIIAGTQLGYINYTLPNTKVPYGNVGFLKSDASGQWSWDTTTYVSGTPWAGLYLKLASESTNVTNGSFNLTTSGDLDIGKLALKSFDLNYHRSTDDTFATKDNHGLYSSVIYDNSYSDGGGYTDVKNGINLVVYRGGTPHITTAGGFEVMQAHYFNLLNYGVYSGTENYNVFNYGIDGSISSTLSWDGAGKIFNLENLAGTFFINSTETLVNGTMQVSNYILDLQLVENSGATNVHNTIINIHDSPCTHASTTWAISDTTPYPWKMVADNKNLYMGASNDVSLYYDGSDLVLDTFNSGAKILFNSTDYFHFTDPVLNLSGSGLGTLNLPMVEVSSAIGPNFISHGSLLSMSYDTENYALTLAQLDTSTHVLTIANFTLDATGPTVLLDTDLKLYDGSNYKNFTAGKVKVASMPTTDPADGTGTLWADPITHIVYLGT